VHGNAITGDPKITGTIIIKRAITEGFAEPELIAVKIFCCERVRYM
jgi:hypothetical protein